MRNQALVAMMKRLKKTVKLLLDVGANIDEKDKFGRTAFMRAAWSGYTQTVNILLDSGADVKVRDGSGKSAFWLAEDGGHTEIVEMLKEAGAKE